MKKNKLKECFLRLFQHFNDPFYAYSGGTMEDRILDSFDKENKFLEGFFEKQYKRQGFKKAEELNENFRTLRSGVIQAAFSYGFTIGKLLDPLWSEVKEAEKVILEDIKKEELILYLPRKGAPQPHKTPSDRV